MDGEIDLETYTISLIRINSAFEKLQSGEDSDEIKSLLDDSFNDLNGLYHEIVDDLNQDEVNLNEYYLFFQNGKSVFPQYIEALGNVENDELSETINKLMNVFSNLNKIADAFGKNDVIE